jgi:hypothetical protein
MAVSFMLEYGELKRTTRFQEEQDTASPFGGGSGTRSIKYAYYFTLAGLKIMIPRSGKSQFYGDLLNPRKWKN